MAPTGTNYLIRWSSAKTLRGMFLRQARRLENERKKLEATEFAAKKTAMIPSLVEGVVSAGVVVASSEEVMEMLLTFLNETDADVAAWIPPELPANNRTRLIDFATNNFIRLAEHPPIPLPPPPPQPASAVSQPVIMPHPDVQDMWSLVIDKLIVIAETLPPMSDDEFIDDDFEWDYPTLTDDDDDEDYA